MDVAKCYQAYAKGDYQLEKTLPVGMVLYDILNDTWGTYDARLLEEALRTNTDSNQNSNGSD